MRRRLVVVAGRVGLVGLCGLVALAVALAVWVLAVPYPTERLGEAGRSSWRIVDRNGVLLREAVGEGGERARWTPLAEVSPDVVSALIAVEDRRFRTHRGVDPVGIGRAVLFAWRVRSGASTLTMQLARETGALPKTPLGKARQAVDALRIERVADKDAILEAYLNRVQFTPGTLGIEAASERLFGKPTRNLSLAEAALLAGLPQAPSAKNPLRHPAAAIARRDVVLHAMRDTGVVTQDAFDRAIAEPLVLAKAGGRPEAMHFTDAVLALHPPTGEVRTTLDRDLQAAAQRMTADHVASLRRGGMRQAAVVVLDNATCDVTVMVGSTDWWEGKDGRNNGATALRQPGSALKPFLYGLAFERGWDPASVAADVPTRYPDGDGLLMHPRNYSERFTGPVLLGEALGRSLNVPAVRLADAVGIDDVLQVMRRAGLDSLDQSADVYGLGLVLGNGEVTLVELARAYAMLARGGVSCTPRMLASDPVDPGVRVLDADAAYLVRDVLSDEALRARAFGFDNPLLVGFPVAVKTGTSTNWRDSWAVGFTDRHTVAVWAGDFGGEPMDQLSGAIGAGPLFRDVIREVTLRGAVRRVPEALVPPDGIDTIDVCALSGAAPGPSCPLRRTVRVRHEDADRPPCAWHKPLRIDRRNGLRASDRCPAAFVDARVFAVLPPTYAAWQAEDGSGPPTAWSPLCPPDAITPDAIVVTQPRPGDVYLVEPGYDRATQTVALQAEVDPPVPNLVWRVDGREVASPGWPYEGRWALEPGNHEVVAVAGDRRSDPVRFEVR